MQPCNIKIILCSSWHWDVVLAEKVCFKMSSILFMKLTEPKGVERVSPGKVKTKLIRL